MVKNWGTRCPDYEENCACCKAWKYFDYLFEIVEMDVPEEEIDELLSNEMVDIQSRLSITALGLRPQTPVRRRRWRGLT